VLQRAGYLWVGATRGRLLARIADAIEARLEELARRIALETGNALRTQARPEAKTTVDIIRYFGGLGGELKGETIPLGEHVLSYRLRQVCRKRCRGEATLHRHGSYSVAIGGIAELPPKRAMRCRSPMMAQLCRKDSIPPLANDWE
jgi:hypothetical protein